MSNFKHQGCVVTKIREAENCHLKTTLTLNARPRFGGVSAPTMVASVRKETVCMTLTAFRGNLSGK